MHRKTIHHKATVLISNLLNGSTLILLVKKAIRNRPDTPGNRCLGSAQVPTGRLEFDIPFGLTPQV